MCWDAVLLHRFQYPAVAKLGEFLKSKSRFSFPTPRCIPVTTFEAPTLASSFSDWGITVDRQYLCKIMGTSRILFQIFVSRPEKHLDGNVWISDPNPDSLFSIPTSASLAGANVLEYYGLQALSKNVIRAPKI
ncbi:hypothetical protein TNCV_4687831 [Trichonephila clavipes]|nr:hypothetical protein TNCV_4687831 [Trichonephila clavipes]